MRAGFFLRPAGYADIVYKARAAPPKGAGLGAKRRAGAVRRRALADKRCAGALGNMSAACLAPVRACLPPWPFWAAFTLSFSPLGFFGGGVFWGEFSLFHPPPSAASLEAFLVFFGVFWCFLVFFDDF
jgi:hypothetical protein